MKWPFKKICLSAASLVLAATSSVNAYDVNYSGYNCQLPSCASNCCGNWSFNGDMLYWKANGSNIAYTADYFNGSFLDFENGATVVRKTEVKNKNLRFKDHFGYRLGLNYENPCSCWGFGLEWTHYNTEATGKAKPYKLSCCDLACSNTDGKYKTHTDYELCLNYLDFTAGRDFCFDPCFTTRAFFGVRYARINQKYKSCSEFEFAKEFIPPVTITTAKQINYFFIHDDAFYVDERHLFNGAGPRFGVDLEWCLGCGFSVYGDAAFSFLFGFSNHDVKDNADLFFEFVDNVEMLFSEQIAEERTFCRDECLQANRPVTDLALGIRWFPTFCCPYRLSFQLGWEHHAFFGQKHARFNDLQNPLRNCTSTLAVYGLTFSTNLSF